MKINEELSPYEKEFHSECNKIKFFCLSLNEIKFQIEFLEKICGKELEIYEKLSCQILTILNSFRENIFIYNSEPSNLFKIITDLVTILGINFQFLRIGLIDCYKMFQNNIPQITRTLNLFSEDILKNSLNILKQSQIKSENKEKLNQYLNSKFESVVSNIFKGLVYIHQFFFLYSKAKNDFNMHIKKEIEDEGTNNEVLNVIINDFSERKFAKDLGIYYEPIHFGSYNNDILLKNESENVVSLCDSYLYYGQTFIKCIQIRKKLISLFKKLINDIVTQSPNNIIEKISHIKDKILRTKNNFKVLGIGTEKSWDLLIQSWNYLCSSLNTFMQFCDEVYKDELKENSERREEYKAFETEWGKYSKKIMDLRNKYTKYYTNEKKKQIKDNPKEYKALLEKENQIKQLLNIQCYDFLNSNVPMIREKEKKRAAEIQDLCNRCCAAAYLLHLFNVLPDTLFTQRCADFRQGLFYFFIFIGNDD